MVIDVVMQVKVANGEKICSEGFCKEVGSIQWTEFVVPFHILPYGGYAIVLGV